LSGIIRQLGSPACSFQPSEELRVQVTCDAERKEEGTNGVSTDAVQVMDRCLVNDAHCSFFYPRKLGCLNLGRLAGSSVQPPVQA
jgi:hypothetical protein